MSRRVRKGPWMVPPACVLFGGTVPPNNHFHNSLYSLRKINLRHTRFLLSNPMISSVKFYLITITSFIFLLTLFNLFLTIKHLNIFSIFNTVPNVQYIIDPNGNRLRNWNSIHINTNMCSLKMSGERTLELLRNWSYGQNKLSNPNLKNRMILNEWPKVNN